MVPSEMELDCTVQRGEELGDYLRVEGEVERFAD